MLYRTMFCITLHVGETDGPPVSGSREGAPAAADGDTRVPDTDDSTVRLGLLLANDPGMKSAFERFTAWLSSGSNAPAVSQPVIQPKIRAALASDVDVVDKFVEGALKGVKHLQRSASVTTAAGVRFSLLKDDGAFTDAAKPLPKGMPATLQLPELKMGKIDRLPPNFNDRYNSEIATALRTCTAVIITQLAAFKVAAGTELQRQLVAADTQFETDLDDVIPEDVDAQTRTRLRASAQLDYTTQRDAHLAEMKIVLNDKVRKRAKNAEKKAEAALEQLTKQDRSNVLTAIDTRVQRFADKLIEANPQNLVVPRVVADEEQQRVANASAQKSLAVAPKSRKATRDTAQDGQVVGGKRKKKGQKASAQKPAKKQGSKKKSQLSKSKPGHLNPQGAQGSSPRGAANQSVSSQNQNTGRKRKRKDQKGSGNQQGKKKSKRGAGNGGSN
jgi:hypothetical protein